MRVNIPNSDNFRGKSVTIILPVKNGEPLVRDAIESINKQSVNISKVILADNNSKDRTIKIVKENLKKSIELEIDKSNKDIGSMNNFFRCINKIETDYFCWLAHDDYLSENWIEENINVHLNNQDCITSFGKTIFLNELDEQIYPTGIGKNMHVPKTYKKGELMKFILERQLFGVFYEYGLHKTSLFKKAFLSKNKIKKIDSIKVGGDTCLVLSLLANGSLYNTDKTKFFRRNRLDSDGSKISETSLFYRIFILELPWSYFIDVSNWISFTYKRNRIYILLLLIITSRFQSITKIFQRILKEINLVLKQVKFLS